MSHRVHRRSGVILLIVLALLALFTLLGLGLVIITSQARRTAALGAKVEQVGDPPQTVLRNALLEAVRGPASTISIMGPHSLLEDMYGNASVVGTIRLRTIPANPMVQAVGQGQFIEVIVDNRIPATATLRPFSEINGYYNGCVLTMLDGPAKNLSTRIVRYIFDPTTENSTFRFTNFSLPVLGPDGSPGAAGVNDDGNGGPDDLGEFGYRGTDDVVRETDRFMVNGREFSGPGFGYNPVRNYVQSEFTLQASLPPQLGLLDAADGPFTEKLTFSLPRLESSTQNWDARGWEMALLPNPTHPSYRNYLANGPDLLSGNLRIADSSGTYAYLSSLNDNNVPLLANEDYDAPDYQNMLPALQTPSGYVVLPSLHRPDLIHYWSKRQGIDFATNAPFRLWVDPNIDGDTDHQNAGRDLRRRIFLRPLPEDHVDPQNPTESRFAQGTQNPGGNDDVWEFREPLLGDLDGDGVLEPGTEFLDLDNDLLWDAGDYDFTGKQFNPITGPWDVDNDGDGVADSVWVDLGMPPQITPDGKYYKRLFAFHCVDLDSRLNLNAHGNPSNLATPSYSAQPYAVNPATPTVTTDPLNIPRGEGYGTAEVDLTRVLAHETFNDTNGNGRVDTGEFVPSTHDRNGNGIWDSEPFQLMMGRLTEPLTTDRNGNGRYDYDPDPQQSDTFSDLNGNRIWDEGTDGRYGESYRLGQAVTVNSPLAGRTDADDNMPAAAAARVTGNVGTAAAVSPEQLSGDATLYGRANFAGDASNLSGAYGSPPGLKGTITVGHDLRGNPIVQGLSGTSGGNESVNDPYQLDLSREGRRGKQVTGGIADVDKPFSIDELEPLLRFYDLDAQSLPARIKSLAPTLANDALGRHRVTTDSWDLPTPALAPSPEIAEGLRLYLQRKTPQQLPRPPRSMTEMLLGKIQFANPAITNPVQIETLARNLLAPPLTPGGAINATGDGLSPDLALGLRFDLNRPFGNNADDNNNGIIDEPEEVQLNLPGTPWQEHLWQNTLTGTGLPADNNGDGLLDQTTDRLARYRYAKHLFILLMLLQDSDYRHPLLNNDTGLLPAQKQDLTTRRLAQFAVNVVDYRDRDSIMTAFEYDADPFTAYPAGTNFTWNVDGYPRTNENTGIDYRTNLDLPRRLVFGCESPDVVMTETIAFHDRRVDDLGIAGTTLDEEPPLSNQARDTTLDQARIPQGSTFVELYCTRDANNPAWSSDLYRYDTLNASPALDLGRMDLSTGTYAVWRLAISYSRYSTSVPSPNTTNDIRQRATDNPDSITFQPSDTATNPEPFNAVTSDQEVRVDRIVWFARQTDPLATFPATTVLNRDRIYFSQSATDSLLLPGKYAVIGPARVAVSGPPHVTTIGHRSTTPFPQFFCFPTLPSGRTSFQFFDNNSDGTYTYPSTNLAQPEIQFPLGIPVAGVTAGGRRVGLSVSEPLFSSVGGLYYAAPDGGTPTTNSDTRLSSLGGSVQTIDTYSGAVDTNIPFDNASLLGDEGLLFTGTTRNYRTIFLQRLANPLLPFNPDVGVGGHDTTREVNPYITVDWMPVDLTVFNGEARLSSSSRLGVVQWDLESSEGTGGSGGPIRFATRERSLQRTPQPIQSRDTQGNVNQWLQDRLLAPGTGLQDPAVTTASPAGNTQYFAAGGSHLLNHTFGYLNHGFQFNTAVAAANGWWVSPNINDGYPGNNNPYLLAAAAAPYNGDPIVPFPHIKWPNRPFASSLELLQVPTSSPSRLLHEFSVQQNGGGQHYQARDTGNAQNPLAPSWPYGHLLSVFHSANALDQDPTAGTPTPASNLHRLFEYVHVPSRFSGTESLLNPQIFNSNWAGASYAGELYPFYAPFNRLSRFRDPGRLNINFLYDDPAITTVTPNVEPIIWRAMTAGYPGYQDFWNRFWQSRQGYVPPGTFTPPYFPLNPNYAVNGLYTQMFALNPQSPTILANPVRSYGSTFQVPLEQLRRRDLILTGTLRDYIEATALRPDASGGTAGERPLLAFDASVAGSNPTDVNDPARNPSFRYQLYQKLGNLLSNRSNVYAIWITTGSFEVERASVNATSHPDGWRLVGELGAETGDVARHRAFYVIDRTIPVGFQRGRNNNVRDVILLEKFIE